MFSLKKLSDKSNINLCRILIIFYLIMNQVIIPKPIYHSSLAQPNTSQTSEENQSASKCLSKGSLIFSKKPSGAFKHFKEKKNRNKERQKSQALQMVAEKQPLEKKLFKLKAKTFKTQLGEDPTNFQGLTGLVLDYFDPNTAPAFVEQSNKEFYLRLNQQKLNESNDKKSLSIHQKIKVQNKIIKQSELQQSQNQFQMQLQEGRKDDPFIVYKKVSIKKLKKQRNMQQFSSKVEKTSGKKAQSNSKKSNQKESMKESLLIQKSKQITLKQSKIIKYSQFSQLKVCKQNNQKFQEKIEDQKQLIKTQKGSDVKVIKDLQMEENYLHPNFVLHLSLESQSEGEASEFDTLDRKKILPMIK